ncbi:MAG TPA: hypothetical protein PKK26_03835 [Candidatus Wallbacteria bacterium]|nr:hypothetical protein [Candidatus Wallbacteria bacterium]
MDVETYTLVDEEILRVGRFKEFDFTPAILDEIYKNFYKLKNEVKPTVKLGHGEQEILERSGYPAVGYISELKLSPENDVIYATITDVPKEVKDLIDTKAYAQKSAEVVLDYEDVNKNKKYSAVLLGLALLGEELPEIKTLADIKQLYFSSDKGKFLFINLSSKEDITMATPEEIKKAQEEKAAADAAAAKKLAADKASGAAAPTLADMVTGLEKSITAITEAMKTATPEETAKIGDILKPLVEKIKPAEAPADGDKGDEAAGDEKLDPATLALQERIKKLEADVELAKKKEKAAQCDTVNLSDKQYLDQLAKETKIAPKQKEKLEKLFFSINKKEANIIRLSDKESVSIKEIVKEVLNELPARIDLSEKTTDSKASEEKDQTAIQIQKAKEMCPGYFPQAAAAAAAPAQK